MLLAHRYYKVLDIETAWLHMEWFTHSPNKQKILISRRESDPMGIASGRVSGVKMEAAGEWRKVAKTKELFFFKEENDN